MLFHIKNIVLSLHQYERCQRAVRGFKEEAHALKQCFSDVCRTRSMFFKCFSMFSFLNSQRQWKSFNNDVEKEISLKKKKILSRFLLYFPVYIVFFSRHCLVWIPFFWENHLIQKNPLKSEASLSKIKNKIFIRFFSIHSKPWERENFSDLQKKFNQLFEELQKSYFVWNMWK